MSDVELPNQESQKPSQAEKGKSAAEAYGRYKLRQKTSHLAHAAANSAKKLAKKTTKRIARQAAIAASRLAATAAAQAIIGIASAIGIPVSLLFFVIIAFVIIILNLSGDTGPSVSPDSSTAGGVAFTTDSCSGKYSRNMAKNWLLEKNFGDPECTASKDAIEQYISQVDPQNLTWWVMKVLPCESGFNPNAWNDPNNQNPKQTPDAGGAWGLFQDGSSAIANSNSLYCGKINPCRPTLTTNDFSQLPGVDGVWGHGGIYDRGDVDWKTQINNAVQLLQKRGRGYWACR